MRVIEILAMGAELRREAEEQCESVNEAHFAVHEVMKHALSPDRAGAPEPACYSALSSQVRLRLIESAIARCGTVSETFASLLRSRQ